MTRYMRSRGYHSVMRSHRYRPILIILLVLLAAFLIFKVAGVGGINESNYEAQRNTRLRSEVQHAVSSVNSLSRLGASSTSAMLGRNPSVCPRHGGAQRPERGHVWRNRAVCMTQTACLTTSIPSLRPTMPSWPAVSR